MWVLNNSVKVIKDNWDITEVDCFTKPHALLMDSISPGMYDTYLFYLTVEKSYGFRHGLYENLDWSFGIHPYVTRQLGFDYHFHYCRNTRDLKKEINTKLKKGVSILLPGNLRELYYSWAYEKFDAFHLFRVKGYDDSTGIYTVIDNMHNMDKPVPEFHVSGDFSYFNIKGADLYLSWYKLRQLPYTYYNHKYITIENSRSKPQVPSALDKLKYFLELQKMKKIPMRYREIYSMQVVISFFEDSKKDVIKELPHFRMETVFGNKKALLAMVIQLVEEAAPGSDLKELQKLKEHIINKWSKLFSIFYFRLYKRNLHSITELEEIYTPLLKLENSFMLKTREIIKEFL